MAKSVLAKKERSKVAKKQVALQTVEAAELPALQGEDLQAWGQSEISTRDIIIPRILLNQPMSDAVTNGDAKFGEFRESLSGELLGNFERGFDIVPFHMRKVWVEYDVTQGTDMKNKKFLRVTPVTPQNDQLPYNDEERDEQGKTHKIMRDYVMEFYVLLKKELDLGAGAIPYILSARRSSSQAGKKLATQMFVKNMSAGKTPPAVTLTVIAKKESNDQGTFAVWDVAPKTVTPAEHQTEAFKWFQMVRAGAAKVDENAYNEEASDSRPPQASGPAEF